MANKTDKDFEYLLARMLGQLNDMSPELLDRFIEYMKKREQGKSYEVLDDLYKFESNKHERATEDALDIDVPNYVDFWYYYDDKDPLFDYEELMDECESKKKKRLAKDINTMLNSVPAYYADDFSLVSHRIMMLASVIIKYNLKECHIPFLNLLRCEDSAIDDFFMDDESASITMYAEMCHDELEEMYEIALDERVMPYARGIAIGAIAKSADFSVKDTLLIVNKLRSIIETYRERAKSDRKLSIALIRSTSLIAARMHFKGLLPLIQETYKKLRISGKGSGTLKRVEELISDEKEHLGMSEGTIEHLERFLEFQSQFSFPERDDDDFDDEDEEYYDDWEEEEDDFDEDFDEEFRKLINNKSTKSEDAFDISPFRKPHIINGKVLITGENFVNSHPKEISTATDRDYVSFANGIVKRISGYCHDLSNLEISQIALKCALYYEDMIADAGIWRSFVERMRKMYGKPLPFYDVDESNYYSDEPNLEDVQLLVWLTHFDNNNKCVPNPENPVLMAIAGKIYEYMNEMFENMPVNEALYDYFNKSEFMNDFYEARDAIKWVYIGSYLTSTASALENLITKAHEYETIYGEESFYQAESTVIYDYRIGPLALLPKEWLAMILESNDRKEDAKTIRDIEGKFSTYHVEEWGNNLFSTFTLKRADGVLLDLSQDCINDLIHQESDGEYFIGCLIHYDGRWYLSGLSSWSNKLKSLYEEMSEKEKTLSHAGNPKHDKLLKQNGGSPLFYFKNAEDVRLFLTNKVGLKVKDINISMLNGTLRNWVVYLSDNKGHLCFMPQKAEVIKDPNNPYYNEKVAKEDYLSVPLDVPYSLAHYLIEKGYLPYAGFVCMDGKEKGRRQFMENYDFVLRCIGPNNLGKED